MVTIEIQKVRIRRLPDLRLCKWEQQVRLGCAYDPVFPRTVVYLPKREGILPDNGVPIRLIQQRIFGITLRAGQEIVQSVHTRQKVANKIGIPLFRLFRIEQAPQQHDALLPICNAVDLQIRVGIKVEIPQAQTCPALRREDWSSRQQELPTISKLLIHLFSHFPCRPAADWRPILPLKTRRALWLPASRSERHHNCRTLSP